MKKISTLLLALAMTGLVLGVAAGLARCAEIRLAWDPNPEQDIADYRVWRGTECLATVPGTTATVTVPDAEPSTFTVTARNAAGESPHSAPLTIPAPNATRLTLQVSTDLKTWTDIATHYDAKKPAAFYRLKVEVRP